VADGQELQGDRRALRPVCRVVNGIRNARYGQIGARPTRSGPAASTRRPCRSWRDDGDAGPSEALAASRGADVEHGAEEGGRVQAGHGLLRPSARRLLLKIAKFDLVVEKFVAERSSDALAIQADEHAAEPWDRSCSTMSLLDDKGIPSACEADILDAVDARSAARFGRPSCWPT